LFSLTHFETANDLGEIEIEAYQVSDQCMALVKDGVITSSKDPKLMRVKKSKKRYIPDVMYKDTNEYNLEVVRKAEPYLPTEFFIIPVQTNKARKRQ
jgi:nuclear protein localization family protein 4